MTDTLFDDPEPEVEGVEAILPTISSSSMSMFDQCNLRWKYRYIDKIKEPSGGPAVLGTFVHTVLEELFKTKPEERTEATARLIARIVWNQVTSQDREFNLLGLSEEDQKKFRQDSWVKIKGLWQLENPTEVEVVSNEERFDVPINGYVLIGYIDRVNRDKGKLVIVDYKTGKAPYYLYKQDKVDQIVLYGYAVREVTGEMPNMGYLYYIGENSEVIREKFTAKKLDAMGEKVHAATEAINKAKETDVWEPNPQPLCGWCPYLKDCPTGIQEVRTRVELGKKVSPEAKAVLAEAAV